jgi:hypothetical protein
MLHAARTGNIAYMGEFKDGFHETQTPAPNALFDECCRDDEGRVWSIGQKFK